MMGVGFTKSAALLALSTIGGATAVNSSDWPPLPSKGFIAGRAAQEDDLSKGNAVFVSKVGDVVVGKPLAISIPQYARLRETREKVIVVQAEEARGIGILGLRGLDGKEAVVTEPEVELLGTERPPN
jgi:hypothetical protein